MVYLFHWWVLKMLLIGHGIELFPSKNSQLPTISNDTKIRMLLILAPDLLLYSGLQQSKHMGEYIPVVCLRLVDNWHGFHHKGHAPPPRATHVYPQGRRKRPHPNSTPLPPLRDLESQKLTRY